jgi:hypothetical protein
VDIFSSQDIKDPRPWFCIPLPYESNEVKNIGSSYEETMTTTRSLRNIINKGVKGVFGVELPRNAIPTLRGLFKEEKTSSKTQSPSNIQSGALP